MVINPVPAATSAIEVTLDNIFTLGSDYCVLDTTAPANDSRGVLCQVSAGDNTFLITNLGTINANTTFSVTIQLDTSSSAGTVSPTVSIDVFYDYE